MLTIRQEQFEALAAANERLFEQRLIAEIRKHYPDHAAQFEVPDGGQSLLLRWIRNRFEQAAAYGIDYEGDCAVFVLLIMENQRLRAEDPMGGSKFLAWTQPLLERENTQGKVKIALIENRLRGMSESDGRALRLVEIIDSLREQFG